MLSMEVFMGKFVDFDEVKGRVSCEQAIAKLGLAMLRKGNQWRMACPTCKSEDPRSLCVTEGKGFYCWGSKTGGSVIDLAAHILGCTTNEAANFLVGTVDTVPGTVGDSTKGTVPQGARGDETKKFEPLDYLQNEHDAVIAVGFCLKFAAKYGIGYAAKGIMRGTVAIPLPRRERKSSRLHRRARGGAAGRFHAECRFA
jgi:hypothetical protein